MSNESQTGGVTRPLIVNMGKRKRKRIKQLKRGKGRLMDTVHEVIDEVREGFGDDADNKVFVPVVVLFERKRRKRKAKDFRLF